VNGIHVNVVPVRHLHQVAQVHHAYAVADVAHHGKVVGDEQVGQRELLLQLLKKIDDLGLDGNVQSGYRLVGDDELGPHGQRPGQPNALPLPSAEFVRERLEREYNLDLIVTAPTVPYQVVLPDGKEVRVDNPSKLPPANEIKEIREPMLSLTIVALNRHVGVIMELMHSRRAEFKRMEYIQSVAQGAAQNVAGQEGDSTQSRVVMEYTMPMVELLADFYNQLKSRTQGYASLDYTLEGYQAAPLVKVDVLINQQPLEALSMIVHRDRAVAQGRWVVEKLRTTIPRQLFEVPIQAAIGGRVVARETIRALRKDVLAKCYGGDVTRKRKLLEKQKEGKKRLKMVGRVEIPQEAFLSVLKLGSEE